MFTLTYRLFPPRCLAWQSADLIRSGLIPSFRASSAEVSATISGSSYLSFVTYIQTSIFFFVKIAVSQAVDSGRLVFRSLFSHPSATVPMLLRRFFRYICSLLLHISPDLGIYRRSSPSQRRKRSGTLPSSLRLMSSDSQGLSYTSFPAAPAAAV